MIKIIYFKEKEVRVTEYRVHRNFIGEEEKDLRWSLADRQAAVLDGLELADKIDLILGTSNQVNATLTLPSGKRTGVVPQSIIEELLQSQLSYGTYRRLFNATTIDDGPGMP